MLSGKLLENVPKVDHAVFPVSLAFHRCPSYDFKLVCRVDFALWTRVSCRAGNASHAFPQFGPGESPNEIGRSGRCAVGR